MPNKTGMGVRSALKIDRITSALKDAPMTTKEICKKLFLSETNAKFYIRFLRLQKTVKVAYWTRTEGGYTPHYGLGRKDAEKPVPFTKHEHYIRYMESTKKDDRYEDRLLKARAKNIKPHADAMMLWIPRRENSKKNS